MKKIIMPIGLFLISSFVLTSISTCDKPSDLNPKDTEMKKWSDEIVAEKERNLKAIADYNKSIEFNSKDSEAYYNRGLAKYGLGDYRGAIADYSKSIELKPKYAEAYYNRGLAKDGVGDYRGAIVDYSKSIALNPKQSNSYYNRGLCKIDIDDRESGCMDLSKAGELGHKEAYDAIRRYCHDGSQEKRLKLR